MFYGYARTRTPMLALSQLATMTDDEREKAFERLRTQPNGDGVRARIRELEARYEMSSSTMLAKWKRRELPDTADFAGWLVLLRAAGVR